MTINATKQAWEIDNYSSVHFQIILKQEKKNQLLATKHFILNLAQKQFYQFNKSFTFMSRDVLLKPI